METKLVNEMILWARGNKPKMVLYNILKREYPNLSQQELIELLPPDFAQE